MNLGDIKSCKKKKNEKENETFQYLFRKKVTTIKTNKNVIPFDYEYNLKNTSLL